MKRKKLNILFAPLSIFISHVTRCLCVAEALKKRGHHITFMSGEKYKKLIEDAGFDVCIVSEIKYEKGLVFGASGEFKRRFNNSDLSKEFGFKKMMTEDAAILKKIKPDLIVYDGRVTQLLPAYEFGIPCFEIRNHIGILSQEEMNFLNNNAPFSQTEVSNDEKDYGLEYAKAMHGFPLKRPLNENLFNLAPVIIPGIPEFEISNTNCFQLRKNVFVGPLFWNGWENKGAETLDNHDGKIVVLVATGSTFPFRKAVNSICKALSDDKFHVIVNAGDNYSIFEEDNQWKNCEFHKYIPLQSYLKKTHLVIHHGGHGTTMHVLKAGLPSIVIPFNGDHTVIAHQLEKLKLGLVIRRYPEDISVNDISSAVDKIINTMIYKENAEHFRVLLGKASSAEEKAADFIEMSYS